MPVRMAEKREEGRSLELGQRNNKKKEVKDKCGAVRVQRSGSKQWGSGVIVERDSPE